jgi:2-methylcitrate dehydratase
MSATILNRRIGRIRMRCWLISLEYVRNFTIESELAYETARYCLMDTLACGFQALKYPACTKLLGPSCRARHWPGGARVPGTELRARSGAGGVQHRRDDPLAGFQRHLAGGRVGSSIGQSRRILAVADYLGRGAAAAGRPVPRVRDVLTAMIKAHEIQGILALENSFNRVGLDHVLLVRVASTAVATTQLGGTLEQVINAVSNAWIDGGALRTYRHAPNTGSRKSWAAGDATSRAVRHALIALRGEMGYPSALSAKGWGFQDVLFRGKPLTRPQPFGSYVMENVLFKISFPAEFHAQTAVECAMTLHPRIKARLADISRVLIETQEPGVRIIDKTGPLSNPADRDHCIQYMTAVPLIFGRLTAGDYEDEVASDPRIDALRSVMEVRENATFTSEYYERDKRFIGNAIQVFFRDGTASERIQVDFPIGHRRRRAEGMPVLVKKFESSVAAHFDAQQSSAICRLFASSEIDQLPVHELMARLVRG